MDRREFVAMVGAGLVGWSRAAAAQQPAMPTIGYLQSGLGSVPAGLKETGLSKDKTSSSNTGRRRDNMTGFRGWWPI